MSMAWERTHRRYDVVRAVLADVGESGEPTIQPALRMAIDEEFGDLAAFLADLARRWYQVFDTRLDALLAKPPADMAGAVRALWHDVASEHRATRILLSTHASHPAAITVDTHHQCTLLTSTGVDLSVRTALTGSVS